MCLCERCWKYVMRVPGVISFGFKVYLNRQLYQKFMIQFAQKEKYLVNHSCLLGSWPSGPVSITLVSDGALMCWVLLSCNWYRRSWVGERVCRIEVLASGWGGIGVCVCDGRIARLDNWGDLGDAPSAELRLGMLDPLGGMSSRIFFFMVGVRLPVCVLEW